jgi:hypothetical protein
VEGGVALLLLLRGCRKGIRRDSEGYKEEREFHDAYLELVVCIDRFKK